VSSGIRSKPLHKTAQLLAASTTLQALMTAAHGSAASAAGALAHVHIYAAIDKDDEHPRPRVIVSFGPDWDSRKVGTGARFYSGTTEICFEFNPADPDDTEAENLIAFADTVGAILNECEAIAGQGSAGDGETYINIVQFTAKEAPGYSMPQAENGESYLIDTYTARWEG
jgi:hypothetical protein